MQVQLTTMLVVLALGFPKGEDGEALSGEGGGGSSLRGWQGVPLLGGEIFLGGGGGGCSLGKRQGPQAAR